MPTYLFSKTTAKTNLGEYKFVYFFLMLFITIFLVCDTTAFRMTMFMGQSVPVSGLIIPVVFALGDLIADVYGYHISRKLIWNTLICQFAFGLLITYVLSFSSPVSDTINHHYNEAFRYIIRTNITSCLSVTCGMFANAFLMSTLKIRMHGKRFWLRTILSSSMSEFILCFVAYSTLYVGLKPVSEIGMIILSVWYYKFFFALITAPLVAFMAKKLKDLEGIDTYDLGISYNPFIYNSKEVIHTPLNLACANQDTYT